MDWNFPASHAKQLARPVSLPLLPAAHSFGRLPPPGHQFPFLQVVQFCGPVQPTMSGSTKVPGSQEIGVLEMDPRGQ